MGLSGHGSAMLIQTAIKSMHSISDGWVRVDKLRRKGGSLELCFSVHKGKRGEKVESWIVNCIGVHEANITDFDGGGLAVYPSSHPAARQYFAPRAEIRWHTTCNEASVLAALYLAHLETVDYWIPFDRYLPINAGWHGTSALPCFAPVSGSKVVCRGPDFLIRAYAKALESVGERAKLTIRNSPRLNSIRQKVLHFGESYVVANSFDAKRLGEPKDDQIIAL